MQQKENTELPQGAVSSCLVYWPSCFQTAANEKQQKPIDKEKRGSEYGNYQRARKREKKEHHFNYQAGQSGTQKQFRTRLKEKLRHGGTKSA